MLHWSSSPFPRRTVLFLARSQAPTKSSSATTPWMTRPWPGFSTMVREFRSGLLRRSAWAHQLQSDLKPLFSATKGQLPLGFAAAGSLTLTPGKPSSDFCTYRFHHHSPPRPPQVAVRRAKVTVTFSSGIRGFEPATTTLSDDRVWPASHAAMVAGLQAVVAATPSEVTGQHSTPSTRPSPSLSGTVASVFRTDSCLSPRK